LIDPQFYTPQYSLPARKSAGQSKMNHRYQEDQWLDSLKQYNLKELNMYLKCDSTVYLVF